MSLLSDITEYSNKTYTKYLQHLYIYIFFNQQNNQQHKSYTERRKKKINFERKSKNWKYPWKKNTSNMTCNTWRQTATGTRCERKIIATSPGNWWQKYDHVCIGIVWFSSLSFRLGHYCCWMLFLLLSVLFFICFTNIDYDNDSNTNNNINMMIIMMMVWWWWYSLVPINYKIKNKNIYFAVYSFFYLITFKSHFPLPKPARNQSQYLGVISIPIIQSRPLKREKCNPSPIDPCNVTLP